MRASCVPEKICPRRLCSRTETDCTNTAPNPGDGRGCVLMGSGSFLVQTTNKIQDPGSDPQHHKINEHLFIKYKLYVSCRTESHKKRPGLLTREGGLTETILSHSGGSGVRPRAEDRTCKGPEAAVCLVWVAFMSPVALWRSDQCH